MFSNICRLIGKNKLDLYGNELEKEMKKMKEMKSTPVLLLGKFHGWRSLVGYSPWGGKGSDTTKQLPYVAKGKGCRFHSITTSCSLGA